MAEALAGLMAYHWPAELPTEAVLVPVPLSPEREHERGFNQAGVLARHLSHYRRQLYEPGVLRRTRATRSQVGLNAQQRRQNMLGAFTSQSPLVHDRAFILIDDVCTTGATLGACAQALLQNGARSVWAYTLARAPFDDADLLN